MKPLALALCLASPLASAAGELPPRNPHLAASSYAIGHVDPAQQDSVPTEGPASGPPVLGDDAIDYAHVGPAHFGAYTSGPYADGRRVIWSNGLDRIVKLDHDSFEVLATHFLPDVERFDEARADAAIARFDASTHGFLPTLRAFREMWKLRDLSAVYTLLDAEGRYWIGSKDGRITAWGDATPGDPDSAIERKAEHRLPAEATGLLMGMNLTFDGRLVVATEHGTLVALDRESGHASVVRLPHSEGAEEKATQPVGYGWVRNGFAIDEAGGIYIASQDHLHKVVWTGERLSIDAADGAWTARYPNGTGDGTGATPSLMGFGAEDRFVVITDGDPVMSVLLFWRDEVPEGWEPPAGAPDERIAGLRRAQLGDGLEALQSEQSVVVAGYGALVVNNAPRNVPWYVPERTGRVLAGFLGSDPVHQPFGVEKLAWDPEARELRSVWLNREVSSPSCVPIVSVGSDTVYLVGAREGRWTLEALDWQGGASRFHSEIGGQRFNPLFSGTLLDEAGRVHFGTPWGRARLRLPTRPDPPARGMQP